MEIVVVGFGPAGFSAASYALRKRDVRVVALEKRTYAIYHPCELPDVISGLLSPDEVVEEPPKNPRLEVHTGVVVEEIDTSAKTVTARSLRDGRVLRFTYDRLVIATGSRPRIPRSIDISNSDAVFLLKTVEDCREILQACSKYGSAVIVGGGFIGIEVAAALRMRGVDVTLVEYCPQVLPGKLDPDMADRLQEALRGMGVKLRLGLGVEEISGVAGQKRVMAGGEELRGGFVVVATGVEPCADLAKAAGIKIGKHGGVIVDEYMRTSDPVVYAAGDVAEAPSAVTGQRGLHMLASTAVIQGAVAGLNATGFEKRYPGAVDAWVVNLRSAEVGGAGLSLEEAKKLGVEAVAVTIEAPERGDAYGGHRVAIRLVARRDTGVLLGGQVLCKQGVLKYVDVIAFALQNRLTVSELTTLELPYTPSLRSVVTPLHTAAEALSRRLG